ncbi:MAG: preprotein translocase subunit SecG [Candidatus Omnitrophota bacterium]
MITLITILHVIICVLLMIVVLIQAGRGGGLVEGFSGVESVFGTKTSAFLTKTTTVLSVLFFITCLSLAVLSSRQGKSLMRSVQPVSTAVPATQSTQTAVPAKELPKQPEAPKQN